jgi:hypothetical protein
MNSSISQGDFVENWLGKVRDKFPNSQTVNAVSDATQSGQLDEARLLKLLRKLSKQPQKEKLDDQG